MWSGSPCCNCSSSSSSGIGGSSGSGGSPILLSILVKYFHVTKCQRANGGLHEMGGSVVAVPWEIQRIHATSFSYKRSLDFGCLQLKTYKAFATHRINGGLFIFLSAFHLQKENNSFQKTIWASASDLLQRCRGSTCWVFNISHRLSCTTLSCWKATLLGS